MAGLDRTLSADPAFRGDPDRLNPEQLLLVAASSCQALAFLARAARAGIDVRSYEDRAGATMELADKPAHIGVIRLAPSVTVAEGTDLDRVERLLEEAHAGCFIANSLNSSFEISPSVAHA